MEPIVSRKDNESTEFERNFLLELDDNGRVFKMEDDEILKVPNYSNLKIKFDNGNKISNNAGLITNAYDRSLRFDIVSQNNFQLVEDGKVEIIFPVNRGSAIEFLIGLKWSGPVFFLFSYTDIESGKIKYTKEIYLIVEPEVQLGDRRVSVDSIQMQTVLSKSLGKVDDWEKLFSEMKAMEYNFIHFTPIQKLGRSDSLYCIVDNNEINDQFFPNLISNEEKLKIVKNTINNLQEKYNIGAMVDIVLNHSASNSEWLYKNPQSGYNLDNCPHLNCAYEMDKLLLNYSDRFSDKRVSCRSAPFIYNENDLNEMIAELSREVYKQNFEEYFLIGIDKYIDEFKHLFASFKKDFKEYLVKKNFLFEQLRVKGGVNIDLNRRNDNQLYDLIFESCTDYGENRYGVVINVEFISLLILHYIRENPNESEFLKEVKGFLNRVNDTWYKKSKEFIIKAIDNVRAYARYEFIELKRYKVTKHKRLVENYFQVFEEEDKKAIFACNGWLFGVSDPTINFALYGNWHYFSRSIVIWGDCPKLNYGKSPEDSPYLWEHMTKYVQDMARIFNGFRLDNAHSTPVHVAEYLMHKAREVNPDLVIIAELFAGTKEREINFVNRIGINILVREAIYCSDPSQLSEKLHRFGGGFEYTLGALDNTVKEYRVVKEDVEGNSLMTSSFKYLTPSKPASIIYDITHDNPTYLEKFNNLGLNLTFLATVGFCQCSVGSTRGFEQLFPYQPSVVKENRLYQYDEKFSNLINNMEEENKIGGENKNKEHTFVFNLNSLPNGVRTNTVRLALSSNEWRPDIFLTKENDRVFKVTLELPKGIHYYKYVLDNNVWVHDPSNPTAQDNSGNVNNIIELSDSTKYNLTDLKMIRREVNRVRNDLDTKCNNQFFLHKDRDLICICRMFNQCGQENKNSSENYDGYVLICRTGYEANKNNLMRSRVELPGEIAEFVCSAMINIPNFDVNVIRSESHLMGVKSNLIFNQDIKFLYNISNITNEGGKNIIDFHSLAPNTVIILKIKHSSKVRAAMTSIHKAVDFLNKEGEDLIKSFDLCDINQALYKCEKEELDNTNWKRGNYEVKDYGKFVYAGLTHLSQLIQTLKKNQALDHPLFKNVREGDWLMNYKMTRLKEAPSLLELFSFINEHILSCYKDITVSFKPYYLCLIVDSVYNVFVKKILKEVIALNKYQFPMGMLNEAFVQDLLTAVVQFTGYIESSKFKSGLRLSLAAGLPHFSTDYMRCWGRDTFISFKGLLLIPGFISEAKQILRNFGSTLRHGLIPNLLDGGNRPRYNSRDSVWFFLQAVKDLIVMTQDFEFLNEEVEMLFLDDDMNTHYNKVSRGEKKIMKVSEIIYSILENHAFGIDFREWRAGREIDEHMRDEGFNIKIYLDKTTGLIYGGNGFNCGTWMDKMGSSFKAGNKGIPATPRDGADVEIIGILYSVLNFAIMLNNECPHYFPYKSVKLRDNSTYSFYEWSLLIKDNFESLFFVTLTNSPYKKNIYKDYISHNYVQNKQLNLQFRPNFLIAMAVSPELFTEQNALKSLELAEKYLLVPNGIGIRTLDYEDPMYDGNYDNSDDSNNYKTAHGFNYHNGPEWIWPLGYYLISKINFNSFTSYEELNRFIYSKLSPHAKYIRDDNWKGIPELMNKNNSFCPGSCNTQAWSISTIIESLYALNK